MAVRVRLNDGVEFVVQTTVEKLREGVKVALGNNALLEVENGDGKMRIVNPVQIVYFEEADEDEPRTSAVADAATAH
jgi:hypothetical protein